MGYYLIQVKTTICVYFVCCFGNLGLVFDRNAEYNSSPITADIIDKQFFLMQNCSIPNEFLVITDIHPFKSDCHHLLGLFLVEQRGHSSQSELGRDHCAHHDYVDGLHQCSPTQDLLREIY